MKKLLTISSILLGLFLFTGVASASTADVLQPASTITYNEDLTVNGTGRFSSIYIGETGIGGVTFFNGTIINIGEYDPVTFGDDVRIDGQIWGGPHKGNAADQGLKIADTLLPGLTNLNDIGSSDLRWKTLYAKDGDFFNSLKLNGENIALESHNHDLEYLKVSGGQINGSLNITGTLSAPAGISTNSLNAGGITTGIINTSGVISNGNLTATGNIYVAGDVDGINVSQENAVWFSTDSDSTPVVSLPSSNPARSKILAGGAIMTTCTSLPQVATVTISLPTNFVNSASSYSVTVNEIAGGSKVLDDIWVSRGTSSFSVHGDCVASSGTANVSWILVSH